MKIVNIKTENNIDDFKSIIIILQGMETDLQRIIYSNIELIYDQRRYFIYQILLALKYLHLSGIVLKSLNPDRIFLNSNCELKIFPMSYIDDFSCKSNTFHTPGRWYKAPETLFDVSSELNPASDVWSVGCILYELIARKPLFPGNSTLHQIDLIVNRIGSPKEGDLHYIKIPQAMDHMKSLPEVKEVDWNKLVQKGASDEIDLIKMMLTWDPSKRITIDDALKHHYFEGFYDPSDMPSPSPISVNDTKELTEIQLAPKLWTEIQEICKKKDFK